MDFLLFVFLAGVFVGLVVLTVEVLIPAYLPRVILLLAGIDEWWSPFRLLPPPGEMYILVDGDPEGPFDSLLESVIGWKYLEEEQIFVPDPDDKGNKREQSDFLKKLGVDGAVWVGFNKYLLWRKVRYDKWEKKPDPSTEYGLVSKTRGDRLKEGDTASIFFRYNLATEIKAAETVGNFPVDGLVIFTAQLTNPVKAFFFAGGWEVQTVAAVHGSFRKTVSDDTIDKLREEHKRGGQTVVEQIKKLGGRGTMPDGSDDPNGLYAQFGVEIIDARFVLFDLVGGDQKMTDATRALEIAKLQRTAKVEEARGNKEVMIQEAKGKRGARKAEAEGIRDVVAAWGSHPAGKTVAIAEAIKEGNVKAIGANVLANIDTE